MADETKKPAAAKSAAAKPATAKSAGEKATAKAAAKPAAVKAAGEKAPAKAPAKAAAKPAAAKPAGEKAPAKAAAKPAAAKAAGEKAPAKPAAKPAAAEANSQKQAAKPAAKKVAEPGEGRGQALKVHHLRPAAGAKKDRIRKGRGEASKGKTAGRGTKGTGARTTTRPGFMGGQLNFIMRSPKLRGFTNPFRVEYQVVNLDKLAELYPQGGNVTVADLVAKGAVRKNELVKVLGNGEIAVKLNVTVDKVSSAAEQKIISAGGTIN